MNCKHCYPALAVKTEGQVVNCDTPLYHHVCYDCGNDFTKYFECDGLNAISCDDCVEAYFADQATEDASYDDDFVDVEPEEHECPCCGSISYTRSHDGYCGSCRRFEKEDAA